MIPIFQAIVIFLLLLLLHFAVPKLHPLLYTVLLLLFIYHIFSTLVFPFAVTFLNLFEAIPHPYVSMLLGSALLFYFSELLASHFAEAGYGSLGSITHFAVKILILTIWIGPSSELLSVLSTFIMK